MAKEKDQDLFNAYDEGSIKSLDWKEHIQLRPGMYIGKLGDGSSHDDGIYVLLKETIDNSIDEFTMGFGKKIDITVNEEQAKVRDYGRGIPLGKVKEVVSKINTGAKYDSKVFQKSVGLNGVGTKAVNALSAYFKIRSIREGEVKEVEFERGSVLKDHPIKKCEESNGTEVTFIPDKEIFKNYKFRQDYPINQVKNYCYLNAGLSIRLNGKRYYSKNGLLDLLRNKVSEEEQRYPIIHLKEEDIEVALTHTDAYGEDYYTFVNGQHTTLNGTHLAAFREMYVKTIRDFFKHKDGSKKTYDTKDIRSSICAGLAIRIQEPVFESQTKTKLGSTHTYKGGPTLKSFIGDFLSEKLDNFLHKHNDTAEALKRRIEQSERERKDMAGVKKIAKERAKKANLHNKKLRDSHIHFNDEGKSKKNKEELEEKKLKTMLFITEGDSASGSITKTRDVQTQAVFSLRGKPLNSYGLKKKVVYENEEFNLLQHALNIEEGLEGLRYNQIIIATDADVDGMHIRLLMLTFFLQFFPDLIKNGHIYILETPLFRVRNKKKTFYCYDEGEKQEAIQKLRGKPEITRFKGLGEISPKEFGS
ncbi:MAG TPA: DNA topoisomerase IV subunit B, partial [Chitinophagaceae bacterium]|nr:DNA topoisomerase IV subunit B [Chitinophagaceae bacterium]